MAISFTSPGALFKLVATATGTTGASVGGWYAWDFKNPTGQSLLEEKYEFSPKKLEGAEISKINKNSRSDNKYSIKTDLCFKNFLDNRDDIEFSYSDSALRGGDFPTPTSSKERSSEIEGCTMMRYFTSEDKDKWSFASETVIKNDKIGIAVWVEADNANHVLTDNKTTARNVIYNVLLFEKEKSNDWKVKWGFASSTIFDLDERGKMKSPNNHIEGFYSRAKNTSTSKTDLKNEKYYSGILEKSEGKEIELFENVFQLVDKTKFEQTQETKIFNAYKLFGNTGGENIAVQHDKNVTNKNLKSWYNPFSGKKEVKWSTFEEYCYREREKRNISEESRDLLTKLCYQQK